MLAGRDDASFLDNFVRDFSSRFAEEGGVQHGAYGKRWRGWFSRADGSRIDQLDTVVDLLRANGQDRQAVIQMWDPEEDLAVPGLKDRPCNQNIMLRADRGALDMTVTCRSNDIVMGCYGANAVHMSFLQEYLAARIGVSVGTYVQFSNNWHVYARDLKKMDVVSSEVNFRRTYPQTRPLVDAPEHFDEDLQNVMRRLTLYGDVADVVSNRVRNRFLVDTALPMWRANSYRRAADWPNALRCARQVLAADWRTAALEWLERRAPA